MHVSVCVFYSLKPDPPTKKIEKGQVNSTASGCPSNVHEIIKSDVTNRVHSMLRNKVCGKILKYCTGIEDYPPMGQEAPITIKFLKNGVLPQVSACFGIIKLPNTSSFFSGCMKVSWEA